MHQVNSVVALKNEDEDQRAFGDQYSLCVSVLILIWIQSECRGFGLLANYTKGGIE